MRVDHKKKLGYGDFVVVCVPPPEETANGDIGASSFDTVTHRDCFPNSVVIPNDDQTTAKRILASIQRLTTTDAGKRYSPVIDYVGSVGSQETKDLTRGPERIIWHKGNPAEVHTQAFDDNDGLFDTALDVFARQAGYTPSEQKRVLNRPKSVSRRTIAVVGGPGTGKTSTCTKMAFCLLLVQHKFLVVALQNGVVDHWTTEMVRRKSEFELVARILLNEQKRLQQTTVVQKTTKRLQTLIERCNNLKLLRALPPPYESKMMDRIDQGFAIGQKGSTYDTTDTTDSAVHEDPLYREGVVQKMLWEEEIQTEAALGAVVEKNYLELERAAERMHELEHQHDDVLRVDSRAFKFPLECSEQYYIREARKNPNGVPDRLKEAVSQHDSTREEVKALGANLNLKERREVLSRYKEARNELYAAVVEQSDMVVTTLSTSQHELVASNCKPDGVILEEAGNVDVATALQAWTYCPEFRASIGDPAQFEPWALSTGRDSEFREMTKFSDLQAWISRGYEHDRLYEQKRAAPGLMAAVSKETYQSQLYDAELTKEMAKDRKALVHREVMWKNHIHVDGLNPDWQACHLFYLKSVDDQATRTDQGESLYNDQELDVVMRDLREYAAKGMPTSEITVLVYYREQLKHIKSRLAAEPSLNKVEVETVRKYQGRSNSIVLVLFTAPYVDEPPHFSAHVLDAGGLTVALSCARFGFCFYGSWLELVRKVRVETWTAKNQHGLILRLCCNAILDGYMLNSTSFEVDKLAERMLPRQVLNTMQRDLRLKPKKSSQTWSTSYVGNTGMTPLPFMDRATQMQKMVDPTGAQATEAAKGMRETYPPSKDYADNVTENKALASEMVGGQVDQDQDMND